MNFGVTIILGFSNKRKLQVHQQGQHFLVDVLIGMAAEKTMANRRLQSILSHLSPPVTTELGKHLEFECRGPHTPREAKLIETLMLSQLHRLGKGSELGLAPCTGEPKSLDMAEEVESRESSSESEHGIGDGDELDKTVRSGITSASAVSSSGAADGKSLEGAPRGHLSAACEFCDIIQGSAPCFKLYEDELCLCILDIKPLSFGHSLILPKAHFPCLEATPPQVAAAMCAAVPLISSALLAATRCDSFNMLVNSGVAAGQVIMHTHFHIIPRCKGDGLWKSESATRKPMRKVQEAKSLAHMVRSKLSSIA